MPPAALHLRDHLQGQRGLAGRLRTVDLDDAAARQAADAERDVEAQRAGGHGFDVLAGGGIAEAHDRALAELLLDLAERGGERLLAVVFHCAHSWRGKNCVANYPTLATRTKLNIDYICLISQSSRCDCSRRKYPSSGAGCKNLYGDKPLQRELHGVPSNRFAVARKLLTPGIEIDRHCALADRHCEPDQTDRLVGSATVRASDAGASATATCAPLFLSAPAAISRAVASLTAPCRLRVRSETSRSLALAALE